MPTSESSLRLTSISLSANSETLERPPFYNKEMPVGIPPLIITLLVDTIKEEMDGEEGFLGFPKEIEPLLYEGKLDDTRRKMLKAMSLVCREWTKPAQDALRRRVFLRDVEGQSVNHLLDSGRCGPWVRELQYWEENTEHLHQKSTSLEILLIRLPNLTALSFGSNHLYPSGITHHLGSLWPTPHLRALHIQCLLGRNNLPNIYSAVSNLHELDLLTLMGEWVHEEDTQSLAPELIGKHPPASLKMLLLRIEFSNGGYPTTDLLSWILQARDGYALRELRLIVTISEGSVTGQFSWNRSQAPFHHSRLLFLDILARSLTMSALQFFSDALRWMTCISLTNRGFRFHPL